VSKKETKQIHIKNIPDRLVDLVQGPGAAGRVQPLPHRPQREQRHSPAQNDDHPAHRPRRLSDPGRESTRPRHDLVQLVT